MAGDLVPQSKLSDELAIPLEVRPLHVVEDSATAPDHLEQTTAAVVVLGVQAEMIGEIVDSLGEERYLELGRTAIGLVCPVLFNERSLDERHYVYSPDAFLSRWPNSLKHSNLVAVDSSVKA